MCGDKRSKEIPIQVECQTKNNFPSFKKINEDDNVMYWGPDVHMVGKELQYKKYSLEETATSYDGMGIQADSEYAELLNYWLHRKVYQFAQLESVFLIRVM